MASRQFVSVTPKWSRTASDRRNPGVIAIRAPRRRNYLCQSLVPQNEGKISNARPCPAHGRCPGHRFGHASRESAQFRGNLHPFPTGFEGDRVGEPRVPLGFDCGARKGYGHCRRVHHLIRGGCRCRKSVGQLLALGGCGWQQNGRGQRRVQGKTGKSMHDWLQLGGRCGDYERRIRFRQPRGQPTPCAPAEQAGVKG